MLLHVEGGRADRESNRLQQTSFPSNSLSLRAPGNARRITRPLGESSEPPGQTTRLGLHARGVSWPGAPQSRPSRLRLI